MAMDDNSRLRVEVAYANGSQVHVLKLDVEEGTTVRRAIEFSGILAICPEINFDVNKVGIFSVVCDPDTVVENDSRIEIYRPLINDPREARRRRAVAEK